jgi:hypothetical protein
MSDTCEMRELTDAELDGVCGAFRHHGSEHHGWGHFGKLWGWGTSWAVSSAIRSIPLRRRS